MAKIIHPLQGNEILVGSLDTLPASTIESILAIERQELRDMSAFNNELRDRNDHYLFIANSMENRSNKIWDISVDNNIVAGIFAYYSMLTIDSMGDLRSRGTSSSLLTDVLIGGIATACLCSISDRMVRWYRGG